MLIEPRASPLKRSFPEQGNLDESRTMQFLLRGRWNGKGDRAGMWGRLQWLLWHPSDCENTLYGWLPAAWGKARPAKASSKGMWTAPEPHDLSLKWQKLLLEGRNYVWLPVAVSPCLPVTQPGHSTTFSICNANDKSTFNISFQRK